MRLSTRRWLLSSHLSRSNTLSKSSSAVWTTSTSASISPHQTFAPPSTPTIAAFTGMITMDTVSTLDQWWSIGMPDSARVWLSASISEGRRVFQQDEDLELDIGYSEGIEAFVGDRRENGGVSTRW